MAHGVTTMMRDMMIEHMDAPVPINLAVGPGNFMTKHQVLRHRTKMALMARGYLADHQPRGSGSRGGVGSARPTHTWITDAGRGFLAKLLADYADALVRAHYSEVVILAPEIEGKISQTLP